MKFEIGKTYEFGKGGRQMKIVGMSMTEVHGTCLVGEDAEGNLSPVGMDETAATHWQEVTNYYYIDGGVRTIKPLRSTVNTDPKIK